MKFHCCVCQLDFESTIEDAIKAQKREIIGIKIEYTFVCPECEEKTNTALSN